MQDLKDQVEFQGPQEGLDQTEIKEQRGRRVAGDQLVNQETEDLVGVMAHLDQ